jgi:hypothetical protein
MTDLVNDLIEALEPFDKTMSSWLNLRLNLPVGKAPMRTDFLDSALHVYVSEQIIWLRTVNGSVEADLAIKSMPGEPLEAVAVMAGRLQPSRLVDGLIIYAAHLAALSSYGDAIWGNVVEVVVMESVIAGEMKVA